MTSREFSLFSKSTYSSSSSHCTKNNGRTSLSAATSRRWRLLKPESAWSWLLQCHKKRHATTIHVNERGKKITYSRNKLHLNFQNKLSYLQEIYDYYRRNRRFCGITLLKGSHAAVEVEQFQTAGFWSQCVFFCFSYKMKQRGGKQELHSSSALAGPSVFALKIFIWL